MDWIGIYGKVATTGVPGQLEIYCEPADKWYQMYAYSPKKTYFISVFMDITEQKKRIAKELEEQKKSEQQLIFSEEKYRRLYETSQDGIMARDTEGQMIDCNKAYAQNAWLHKKRTKTNECPGVTA